MLFSDWSSDVCSSDLQPEALTDHVAAVEDVVAAERGALGEARGAGGALDVDGVVELQALAALAQLLGADLRTEARRVGKRCVSTCRSRGSRCLEKKNHTPFQKHTFMTSNLNIL